MSDFPYITHIASMRTLFILVVLCGIWLLASPFVLGYLGSARGNALVVGLIVTVIGIMGIAGLTPFRRRR